MVDRGEGAKGHVPLCPPPPQQISANNLILCILFLLCICKRLFPPPPPSPCFFFFLTFWLFLVILFCGEVRTFFCCFLALKVMVYPPPPPTHTHIKSLDPPLILAICGRVSLDMTVCLESWSHRCLVNTIYILDRPPCIRYFKKTFIWKYVAIKITMETDQIYFCDLMLNCV